MTDFDLSMWYAALLEEYKSLRSEAVAARDAQLSILRVGVTLIAALIGLGVTLRKVEHVGGLLLSVVVPIVVILSFELWIGEIQRAVRAGAVVASIEKRLAALFLDLTVNGTWVGPPMGWETWLRKAPEQASSSSGPWPLPHIDRPSEQQRASSVRALVIFFFLFLLAAGSYALGLDFLWHVHPTVEIAAATSGLAILVLLVRAFLALRGIADRDVSPDYRVVWPTADPVQA